MKKLLLSVSLCLLANFILADGSEKVCVLTDQQICYATELGPINPCTTLTFVVNNLTPPTGFAVVGKFEWFVNDVSVKTTTSATDNILDWSLKTRPTNVYCKVTYKKDNGDLSSPYTSTTFSPIIKILDFPANISITTPLPNYNCTSGTVSFSLPETSCSGNGLACDDTYNVLGSYNITWQAPVGWVQTSLTDNGSNVSFTPDANSSGTLTATIHLPQCTYTETRTFIISRGTEPPTFTRSTFQECNGSSTNVSINPVCGALNYTYTVVGNPGVKFASNGLQVLTTTSTSVSVSATGGASINSLKAKTNFSASISSSETNVPLTVYATPPTMGGTYFSNGVEHPLKFYLGNPSDYNSVCNYARDSTNMSVKNASLVTWTQLSANPGPVTFSQYGNNNAFYLWSINQTAVFRITSSNGCGSLSYDFGFKSIDCSGGGGGGGGGGGCPQFVVSPNPAQGTLHVVVPNIPAPCDPPPMSAMSQSNISTQRSITQIKIYDNSGNLKKSQNVNKAKQATVNLAGLRDGVYIIEISDGTYKETQQVIIQK